MKLLLIRHAIAEDREQFAQSGEPDEKRPLTKKGVKRMRRAARGIRTLVPDLNVIATSPLVRAARTAALLADAYQKSEMVATDTLIPESPPSEFSRWLGKRSSKDVIAAVGHEPHLGTLLSWLLTGSDRPLHSFKKGGVALIDWPDAIEPAGASLVWALTPGQLRRLSD